jgi:uncharacterized membrane protein YphA (DoxX/SURF4 family)
MSGAARAMLRMSIGYLLVIWGVDKLVNPAHGLDVSDHFYLGVFTFPGLMPVFGIAELILGGLVIVGIWGRYTYPVVVVIAAITAAGVWRSIVDPWGWYLQGANALFYPSLIILAASLVLLADEWQVSTRAREGPLTNEETFR